MAEDGDVCVLIPTLNEAETIGGVIEGLHDQFAAYLDAVDHPENKRAKASRMFRRLLGRADPTPREVRTLQGLLRTGTERSEEWDPASRQD